MAGVHRRDRRCAGGAQPVGYYKDPEKTAERFKEFKGQRWVVPGDFATVEPDGRITFLGRGSKCINTGGEKVFPEEVEEILEGADGKPCGIFRETAQGLVERVRTAGLYRRPQAQVREDLRRAVRLAGAECLRNGITSFQDAGSGIGTIDLWKRGIDEGALQVRLWAMLSSGGLDAETLQEQRVVGYGNDIVLENNAGYPGPFGDPLLTVPGLTRVHVREDLSGCEQVSGELLDAIIDNGAQFAQEVLAPLNRSGARRSLASPRALREGERAGRLRPGQRAGARLPCRVGRRSGRSARVN